jgi:hypothetical protein
MIIKQRTAHHFAVLGVATLLLLPAIFRSPMTHDSFWIDWVWADQFNSELAHGNLYPRWLPFSNGGRGSPTFYFYPPLAFYVSGFFGLLGLSTYATVLACFWAGFVISGYAMLTWLRDTSRPLLGSLVFMAAPYHVMDFYVRGAQAEFLAVGLIPLVGLGVRRASENRPALLAFAYAALILTHVPLALLVSLFLNCPYCILRRPVSRYALPLLFGLAMAAIYLLPALALDSYRHSERLWSYAYYQPKNWNVFDWNVPTMRVSRAMIATVAVALAIPIVTFWFVGKRRVAIYAATCWILAVGITPALWSLPLLRQVQFPFRVMPLVEFAIAIGVASARPRLIIYAGILPSLLLTIGFASLRLGEGFFNMEEITAWHPDVRENTPTKPLPWPAWPEQVGFTISLIGLAGAGALAFRERRRKKDHPA